MDEYAVLVDEAARLALGLDALEYDGPEAPEAEPLDVDAWIATLGNAPLWIEAPDDAEQCGRCAFPVHRGPCVLAMEAAPATRVRP